MFAISAPELHEPRGGLCLRQAFEWMLPMCENRIYARLESEGKHFLAHVCVFVAFCCSAGARTSLVRHALPVGSKMENGKACHACAPWPQSRGGVVEPSAARSSSAIPIVNPSPEATQPEETTHVRASRGASRSMQGQEL